MCCPVIAAFQALVCLCLCIGTHRESNANTHTNSHTNTHRMLHYISHNTLTHTDPYKHTNAHSYTHPHTQNTCIQMHTLIQTRAIQLDNDFVILIFYFIFLFHLYFTRKGPLRLNDSRESSQEAAKKAAEVTFPAYRQQLQL